MLHVTNTAGIGELSMPIIRKIQSRDIQALADTFNHREFTYFNDLYVDYLQDKCHTVIATVINDDERKYLGYASVVWESSYTQFWRRNIPEITDLYVDQSHRRTGIATQLIEMCELATQEKNLTTIGISVQQSDEFHAAQALYQKLGYHADEFGVTQHNNQLHLVKKLP